MIVQLEIPDPLYEKGSDLGDGWTVLEVHLHLQYGTRFDPDLKAVPEVTSQWSYSLLHKETGFRKHIKEALLAP